eukprot:7388487-Prymnesium_polylepis.1
MQALRRYLCARLRTGNLQVVRSVHVLPAASMSRSVLLQLVKGGALHFDTPQLWRKGYFTAPLALTSTKAMDDIKQQLIVYDAGGHLHAVGEDGHKSKGKQRTQTRYPYARLRRNAAGKLIQTSRGKPMVDEAQIASLRVGPHDAQATPLGIGLDARDNVPAYGGWADVCNDVSFGAKAQVVVHFDDEWI